MKNPYQAKETVVNEPSKRREADTTPQKAGRGKIIAVLLNVFFLPYGYYYLKAPRRFWFFTVFMCFYQSIFLLYLRVWPESTWGRAHLAILMATALGMVVLLIVFVIRDSLQIFRLHDMSAAFYFRLPHSLWFLPLYLIISVTINSFVSDTGKSLIMGAHNIPSVSMSPTLQRGDYIFADYINGGDNLRRGDLIVFGVPGSEDRRYIKRLIGLPGDVIRLYSETIRAANRRLWVTRLVVNDRLLPLTPSRASFSESELDLLFFDQTAFFRETMGDRSYLIQETASEYNFPYTGKNIRLRQDEYFVVSDNRDDSRDSRMFGPIKRKKILGRYMYTYFSINWHNENCAAVTRALKNGLPRQFINSEELCSRDLLSRISRATLRSYRIGRVER